ncbi:MAG: hypothetical protein IJV00_06430, partial [Clostridia bacterium]|nr:hypothetical protein [Clostridia bacterium]
FFAESSAVGEKIRVFMPDGYGIGAADRRRLIAAFRSEPEPTEVSVRAENLFIKQMYLVRLASCIPSGCPPFTCDSGPGASDLLSAAYFANALRRGADAALVFGFGEDGVSVRFPDGAEFDPLSVTGLFLSRSGQRRVYFEPPLPSLLTRRFPTAAVLDDVSRKNESPTTLDRLYFFDPAFAAAELLRLATVFGTDRLEKMLSDIPPVFVEKRFVLISGSRDSFAEKINDLASNGLLDGENVRIVPGGPGAFRIWAQSTRTEAARELCDRAQDLILN